MDAAAYQYDKSTPAHTHAYLMPAILDVLPEKSRILEVGCGNGANAAHLTSLGHTVVGVDPSEDGVRIANETWPDMRIHQGSGYDDLAQKYGRFPVILSLEVIEHVYDPRLFARRCFEALEPGGMLIMSTPYHGYAKNLALAVTGKMDRHFTALWDHGHIKFWSMDTLSKLLHEAGFVGVKFERVGRVPPLAKSMIAIARRAKALPLPSLEK